jgi:N-acyl-L-homoserine lactone synthetase
MIEFVTVENVNQFLGNPLADQHRLRYRSIIERQNWDVPNYCQMEFDQYDNPAAKYLVYRDEKYVARGVSRFYPTWVMHTKSTPRDDSARLVAGRQ